VTKDITKREQWHF